MKTLFPITHSFVIRSIRGDDEPAILEIYRGAGSNNWLVNPSLGLPSSLFGMNNIRTRTQGLHKDPPIDFENVTGSITYAHTPLETWEDRTERENIHWVSGDGFGLSFRTSFGWSSVHFGYDWTFPLTHQFGGFWIGNIPEYPGFTSGSGVTDYGSWGWMNDPLPGSHVDATVVNRPNQINTIDFRAISPRDLSTRPAWPPPFPHTRHGNSDFGNVDGSWISSSQMSQLERLSPGSNPPNVRAPGRPRNRDVVFWLYDFKVKSQTCRFTLAPRNARGFDYGWPDDLYEGSFQEFLAEGIQANGRFVSDFLSILPIANDDVFQPGQSGMRIISRRFWDAPWMRYPHLM